MTSTLDNLILDRKFDEFEYRLLYLRPSPYSDERIAVGLVANAHGHLETRFISSLSALGMLEHLFGEDGVEQFHFAADELRRTVAKVKCLDSLSLPTDLLSAGETLSAFTFDRNTLLTKILDSASCLVRRSTSCGLEIPDTVALPFTRDLFEHMTRLNPLTASQIFHRPYKARTGETMELPIFGNKIFGAPVSFATADHRIRAESWVARISWLRDELSQEPRIYLLAPPAGDVATNARRESGVRELRAIAKHSKLPLKETGSTEEMAVAILADEAA